MDATSAASDHPPKAFSCIRCFERKVKCDKRSPACTNCVKSNVDCIFRIPPAPRRRKKRTPEDLLLARLKRCEELLKTNGIDIDSPSTFKGTASEDTTTLVPANKLQASEHFNPVHANSIDPRFEAFTKQASDAKKPGRLLVDQGKSRFIENNLWTSLSDEVSKSSMLRKLSCRGWHLHHQVQ